MPMFGNIFGAVPNSGLATMAQTTVKGRALADGGGVPLDLTAAQIAAIVGSVGGALKVILLSTTYDLSTASGTQNITGAGFTPTVAIVLAAKFNVMLSVGILTGSATASVAQFSDATTGFNSAATIQYTNGALTASQVGAGSLAADGISIAWTKTGSPTGTLNQYVLCLR